MPAKFNFAFVPDPYAALSSPEQSGAAGVTSYLRQRGRRTAILAVARRLLAEGPAAFTLRRVAETSGVSVQTLRNSFGRREELMVSAIDEHTGAIWQALGRLNEGPLLFLYLAEMYAHCARISPDFLRATVTAAVASAPALRRLQRYGSAIKAGHLRRMAAEGVLRAGVDAAALAAQITRLDTFMIYEWASGGDPLELRDELALGNRLLLLGAVQPRSAAGIETWTPTAMA